MGLSAFGARNPTTLSGGEKKRLLLACLAAIGPDLWILDESLAELDRSWRETVLDILLKERRTVLALDSRWSALLAERGNGFAVLSREGLPPRATFRETPGSWVPWPSTESSAVRDASARQAAAPTRSSGWKISGSSFPAPLRSSSRWISSRSPAGRSAPLSGTTDPASRRWERSFAVCSRRDEGRISLRDGTGSGPRPRRCI